MAHDLSHRECEDHLRALAGDLTGLGQPLNLAQSAWTHDQFGCPLDRNWSPTVSLPDDIHRLRRMIESDWTHGRLDVPNVLRRLRSLEDEATRILRDADDVERKFQRLRRERG